MSPFDSDDLTQITVATAGRYAVLRSHDNAEDDPEYATIATFGSKSEADAFVARKEVRS